MDYITAYDVGLLMPQDLIVMTVIRSFLLLDTNGHRIHWNLLYIIREIFKDVVVYAWALTILQ